jgi:hypothetical protein
LGQKRHLVLFLLGHLLLVLIALQQVVGQAPQAQRLGVVWGREETLTTMEAQAVVAAALADYLELAVLVTLVLVTLVVVVQVQREM